MIKIIIKLLLCLWVLHCANAQEVAKTFRLDTYRYDNVISETDDNGNLFLCFYYKNRFEIKVLDKNKNINSGRAFKIKDFDRRSVPVGVAYDNTYIYFYFLDPHRSLLSRLIYDRDNIMVPRFSAQKIMIPRQERFLEGINVKGQFKLLFVDEHTNDFVVRSHIATFDTLPTARIPSGCEKLAKVLQNQDRDITLKRMYSHNDNIQNTRHTSKLYFNKQTLQITVDDKTLTHFFTLDLSKNTCQYNKLNFHLHRCADADIKAGNSHIKDGRLFRVTFCSSIMNFSVVDLDSMLLAKNYNITPDKTIDIKTGEMVSEINYEDRSDTKDFLRDTEEFLDNIEPEGLGVAVSAINDKDYLLQIGSSNISFYTVSSPGYGPSFGMGGTGVWLGGGGIGSPSVFGNPVNSNTYRKTTDVYFKSILDQNNLAKSDNNYMEESIYDQIMSYQNAKVNTAYKNMSVIIENENEILYGYFNGKDDLYYLVKFNP